MTDGSNDLKILNVAQVLDLAGNKHIIDAFVTDEYGEQELVVAIVARVRLADIKTKGGWKATVVDAKRSHVYDSVEINTEPESRIPYNGVNFHHNSGTFHSDYVGYNKGKQQEYIKKNSKKSSERYHQFYSEPLNSADQ